MKLQRNSWLIRWAYFGADYVPRQTTLCALFWRIILLTPLKVAFLITLGCMVVWTMFITPFKAFGWWGLLVTPSILLLLWLLIVICSGIKWLFSRSLDSENASIVSETIDGFKHKFCPIIELEHEPINGVTVWTSLGPEDDDQ
jgi:hypothetical protein